ncbi:unnamed protein product [Eruca vesicaria subsp. sativa]|uniref:Uncharacterized protein n=1 Tax=Eruca vesicaria subsp. sativa TaxID=29727 RepID=A0ABC8LK13_ERUVS|nr:unnamed protein product [Eruca vesicaria subsp. sativa]
MEPISEIISSYDASSLFTNKLTYKKIQWMMEMRLELHQRQKSEEKLNLNSTQEKEASFSREKLYNSFLHRAMFMCRLLQAAFNKLISEDSAQLPLPSSKRITSLSTVIQRKRRSTCILNSGNESGGVVKGDSSEWRILERWEVPWEWQTVSLTLLACVLRFKGMTSRNYCSSSGCARVKKIAVN